MIVRMIAVLRVILFALAFAGLAAPVNATYAYDGNLKRVKEVRAGKTIYNIYSRATGGLLYRDQASDAKTTDYVNVGGAALRLRKTGAGPAVPEYAHFDLQGSAVAASDASGAVAWRESYRPYGRTRLDPPANANDAGYTGHLRDDATGLNYMQARYYDAAIGRFYSTDPIGYQDQLNLYAYVANDPTNLTDPTGECPQCLFAGLAGGVAGVAIHVATGGPISAGGIAGAFTGGAVTGAIFAGTGNLTAANAAGAFAGSIVEQGVSNGIGNINVAEAAAEGVVGAAAGKLAPGVKIPGITSGRNSMAAVTKSTITKLANGTISNVSAKTLGKASVVGAVGGAAEGVISRGSEVTGATDALAGGIENGVTSAANSVFRAGPENAIPNTPLPPKEEFKR